MGEGRNEVEIASLGEFEDAAQQDWAPQVRALRADALEDADGSPLSPREWADWLIEDVPRAFPALEELSLYGMRAKKSELERICAAGVFSGLRELELWGTALSAGTFPTVLSALESASRLESLMLYGCSLGKAQVKALVASEMLGRLTRLELGGNSSFGSAGADALAAQASRLVRLERLGLHGCGVPGAAAKKLANADWAESMERINLSFNPIHSNGVVAFARAGRLGWLCCEVDGVRALSLHDGKIGTKGLLAILGDDEATRLGILDVGWIPEPFDESGLRAMLDWARAAEVAMPGVRFQIEGDEALFDEVMRSEVFEVVERSEPAPPGGRHDVVWSGEDDYDDGYGDYSQWERV